MIETLHRKRLAALLSGFLLCCSSPDEIERPPATTVVTTISGRAHNVRPLSFAPVQVIDLLQFGELLFEGQTDERGAFEAELGPIYGDVLLVVGGLELLVSDLQLNEKRSGLYVGPITHLASGYAMWRHEEGTGYGEAFTSAKGLFGEHFGDLDVSGLAPHNVFSQESETLSDAVLLGLLQAGLQRFDINALHTDIRFDGLFDGAAAAPLPGLSPDTLRLNYALSIADFVEGPGNATAFVTSDLAFVLTAIEQSTSSLFPAAVPPTPRDSEAPVVQFEVLRGNAVADLDAPLSGSIVLEVSAQDASDIQSIAASLEGETFEDFAPESSAARFFIDTQRFADGQRDIELVATDVFGNAASVQITLTLDNTPPLLTVSKSVLADPEGAASVVGHVVDSSGVLRVFISSDNFSDTIVEPEGPFSFSLQVDCEASLQHVFSVTARDAAFNTSAPSLVTVVCLLPAAELQLISADHIQHTDLTATLLMDGRGYSYSWAPNPEVVQLSENTTPTLSVYAHLLDEDEGAYQPELVFRAEDAVSVEYSCRKNGMPLTPETALSARPDGLYALLISYQSCGALFVESPQDVFEVRITVTGQNGQSQSHAYPFSLEVLYPPAFLGDCQDVLSLHQGNVAALYTSALSTPAIEGRLHYPLATPFLASRTLSIAPSAPRSSSRITTLAEERFAGPWEQIPREGNCAGQFLPGPKHTLNFPLLGTSVCLDQAMPDDRDFYTAADGPISTRSEHVPGFLVRDLGAPVQSQNGSFEVSLASDVEVTATLDSPRLSIGLIHYNFDSSTPVVPPGFTAPVPTIGRYRMPSQWHRDGVETESPFGATVSLQRAFVTRPYIAQMEVTVLPFTLTATLLPQNIPIAVQTDASCTQATQHTLDLRSP